MRWSRGWDFPPGLSRLVPRKEPVSTRSLLCRRALSMSIFLRRVRWFASGPMVPLFSAGIVFVLDWEKGRSKKPGPTALMGVC